MILFSAAEEVATSGLKITLEVDNRGLALRLLDCDYVYDGYGWPKLMEVQVPSRLEKIWILLCDFYYLEI